MNLIDRIQADIAALEGRNSELRTNLSEATATRFQHAHEAVLGKAQAYKAYASAVAVETVATALVADAARLHETLSSDLAVAQRNAEAETKRIADEAYGAAFRTRLMAVVDAFGIALPADREAFVDGARRGYEWLKKVYILPEVDRKHDLCFWQESARVAGHGSVRPDELIAAAYVSGNVLVEDGGKPWNRYLGISLYGGHVANPVPFDAPLQERASTQAEATKAEPVYLLFGQNDGRCTQHAIA